MNRINQKNITPAFYPKVKIGKWLGNKAPLSIAGILIWITAILGIFLTVLVVLKALDIKFWRHDALMYVSSYKDKLQHEGRWINYYLFVLLRHLNGHLSWFLSFSCFTIFFFRLSSLYTKDKAGRILLAVICLLCPCLISLLLWPSTLLPASVFLLLATYLASVLPIWLFFGLFGVLFFGTYPTFYFFLPLLFLGNESDLLKRPLSLCYVLIPIWAAGFVLGYFCSSGINLLFFGNFGVELSNWRHPRPASDLVSLLDNLFKNFKAMIEHLSLMLPNRLWGSFLAIILLWFAILSGKRSRILRFVVCEIVCVAIITAYYILMAPSGISIPFRSLHHVFVGAVYTLVFLSLYTRRQTLVLSAMFLIIGLPMWKISYEAISWYSKETTIIWKSVHDNLPKNADKDKAVIVDIQNFNKYYSKLAEKNPYKRPFVLQQGLSDPIRWRSVLYSLGYKNITFCPPIWKNDKDLMFCEECFSGFSEENCELDRGQVCVLKETENELIIRLTPGQ